MPIINPNVAQANTVKLPATGIDPTAAAVPVVAANPTGVVLPEVSAQPTLSAADAALIEATKAQFAGNGATTEPTTATTDGAAQGASEAGAATGDDTATPPPELTAKEKLAAKIEAKKAQVPKLLAEIEKLEAQYRSVDLLDGIKAGSVIKARVGRAETAREVVASVTGVQTLEGGDVRYKIFFGEGFDAETVVIQSSQIIDVVQV